MSRYNAPHDPVLVARWTRWSKWVAAWTLEDRIEIRRRYLKIGAFVAAEHVQHRGTRGGHPVSSQTLRYPAHGHSVWSFSEEAALKKLYAKR